jgi:hypothetical protein
MVFVRLSRLHHTRIESMSGYIIVFPVGYDDVRKDDKKPYLLSCFLLFHRLVLAFYLL